MKLAAFAALAVMSGIVMAQDPPAEDTTKVIRGDLDVVMSFDGALVPVESAEVRAEIEAYQGELVLADVAAHGKAVRKGDTLARLDAKKIDEQIRGAENELAAARTALARAEEDGKLAERGDRLAMEGAVRAARDAASALELFEKIDRPLALQDAEQDVQRMQDSIDDQTEELDQLLKMYKSEELTNATAEIVVKRAKRSLERTKVSLEMTKTRTKKTIEHDLPQQHEMLKSGKDQTGHALEQLQKSAPHAKHDRETGLVRSRHAVTAAEDTLAKLQKDREGLTLKSPMDGTAYYGTLADGRWAGTAEAMKALRKGEKVQAMQVAMTVVGRDLDVHVGVQEADLHQFVAGLDATVVPTGFPSLSWKGKTGDAASIAGMDGMFAASVRLAVSAPRVVAGMRAKVTVDVAELKGVLLLPAAAVKDEGGKKWVSKKGSDKPSEVKVGKTDGRMVEITDGVKEGDEVLSMPK